MALIRWDPFRALRRREDLLDDVFPELFRRFETGTELEPAVEVGESEGEVTVKVQVPGVQKDQLALSLTDDVLTVRGEARKEAEERKKSYYRQEIRYGAFQRAVALPAEVDAARATAELRNGVLTVTLPKSRQPKAHEIKVAVT